ncbi:dienelactone hydrolase family protein [Rhabdothermincola salaria]|uniref:dienelactone hydrolase family protein n=1 Tax=Rhabdothermincola salaria TaxID=2903142 RepID=UPI001E32FAA3|nr:dienelactone hydrolase family protein [Rhabdothermincola salaria]MCD9625194.1 dienelactone hydrolase family protein [Rhabdothermincola salaria]
MADFIPTRIEIPGPDGTVPALTVEPSGEVRGGVVVIQEAFGLTGHIAQVAADLAEAGYRAVAPALFHRSGSPVFGYDDLAELGPVIGAMTGDGIAADVDAAISELARGGVEPGRTAIIGFCMGGSVAFATAARRPLGAAVTYYGGGIAEGRFGLPSLLEMAPDLETPWLGLYGDLDAHIPVAEVEQLRHAAQGADVPTEVVRYPDADHGFHCRDRSSFHPASSADAWRRTLDLLTRQLG